ncbi:MAG TPA: hypothetical protein GX534_02705 [Thermoanaerobacterales bacterium]|nr:hypothetical protein [Thermoanaerobacterales bacterium]
MFKKVTCFLITVCCVISLAGCSMKDPQATMNAPAIAAEENKDKSDAFLSKLKKFLPENAELIKITNLIGLEVDWFEADLTGDQEPEILISFMDKDNRIGIIVLEKDGDNYKRLYQETFENEDNKLGFEKLVNMRTATLMGDETTQVVISYDFYGADFNSLSLHVLGYDSKRKTIDNFLSVMDVPKANLEVKGDSILVQAMGVTKKYSWDGNTFIDEQIFSKPDVKNDDVAIHYSMSAEGPLEVSTDEVTLKVGQRLILIRDDKLKAGERIMQSADKLENNDMLDYVSYRNYIAQKAGTLTMTIVPNGGYDWDNAKDIKITVVE